MVEAVEPDSLQIGETEDSDLTAEVRRSLGEDFPIAQVIHVDGPQAIERAKAFFDFADTIHLDSAGERPGGNGAVHDWGISSKIAKLASENERRVMLAGGLTTENVVRAIKKVRPDGVDVESGIKAGPLRHDPELVTGFVRAAQTGFQRLRVARSLQPYTRELLAVAPEGKN
jgi:phosphoribosylanthranilate isomerase